MYFYIKFTYKDEIMESDPNVTLLPCEWVVRAESEESAIEDVKKDVVIEKILEIREISVEERIERETKELLEMVPRDYLRRRYGKAPLREYMKVQDEIKTNLELQYIALKEFNMEQRLYKRLSRQEGFKDMTMAEFHEKVNQLIDAKDEEEFNRILKITQKKN